MGVIRFFGPDDLDAYTAAGDPLQYLIGLPGTDDLTTERWLRGSIVKRMLAWEVYGELLTFQSGQMVTDIGSGLSSLTVQMAHRHFYRVVDPVQERNPSECDFLQCDWRGIDFAYETVIAADLFPNVDQGLAEFLERSWRAKTVRLLLTTYPDRYYKAKRPGGEILTVKAWDWAQTADVLWDHGVEEVDIDPPEESLFDNGRQVCLVEIAR